LLYSDIRDHAETGDMLVVQGNGFVSKLIRVFTGQSFSHVAVLTQIDTEKTCLMIVEMREFRGWNCDRASGWFSDRIDEKSNVFFVKRPKEATDTDAMFDYLWSRRKLKYDYFGLLKVWWSAIRKKGFRKGMNERSSEVCSTFAIGCSIIGGWEKPDMDFNPGQIMNIGDWMAPVIPDPVIADSAISDSVDVRGTDDIKTIVMETESDALISEHENNKSGNLE